MKSNFYRNTLFHRVVPGFVIEGGGYTTGLVKKEGRFAPSPGYAVFGTVVSGMAVVDTIAAKATGTVHGFSDVPLADVTIISVLQIR